MGQPRDAKWFRHVLGHFPTGVTVVTAIDASGEAIGMAIGSFTSVSLDPPLVAFLPDTSSTTFPKIQAAGRFCVNVLSAEQTELCRQFARTGGSKFAGIDWHPSPVTKSPMISGAQAWIDCTIETVHEAGDHFIVVGEVLHLDVSETQRPLLFFQGGYGRFSSLSLSTRSDNDLLHPVRQVEIIRPRMEALASELDMECLALVRRHSEMVIIASARTMQEHGVPTRVGLMMPLVPPMGALLVAWEDEPVRSMWLASAPDNDTPASSYLAVLDRVREQGWSIGLMSSAQEAFDGAASMLSVHSPTTDQIQALKAAAANIRIDDSDPADLSTVGEQDIRSIAAPVFDHAGEVVFSISLFGRRSMSVEQVNAAREHVVNAASQMTADLLAADLDEMAIST